MTSRRELLKAGLVASALPIAARAAFAHREPPVSPVPLYKVLYDTRFPAAVAFAQRATARGLAVHGIDGDMTRVWYDDLHHRWRQGPAAIAGLTAHGALFCLERLAWVERLRVVYRGEHSVAPGAVTHRLDGPAPMLSAAAATAAETSWGAVFADVVAECPRGRAERCSATLVTRHAGTAPGREPLYSWVIAPVSRA